LTHAHPLVMETRCPLVVFLVTPIHLHDDSCLTCGSASTRYPQTWALLKPLQ